LVEKLNNKTFEFKDLTIELHPDVYEPAEDTFQLIEAIQLKRDDKVLEIGTGCGLISLICAKKGANVVCTDINPIAVELTKKNNLMNQNKLNGVLDVRLGDLFSVIDKFELFDIIVFNPPYLPTKPDERVLNDWHEKALDGGPDGLLQTKRFLEKVSDYLEKDGCGYFVFSSLSDRKKLEKYLTDAKLKYKIINSYKYNDEILDVYFFKK